MQEPTTVTVDYVDGTTTHLNCGFITDSGDAFRVHIGGHLLLLNKHYVGKRPDLVAAAQKFADLLYEVGV